MRAMDSFAALCSSLHTLRQFGDISHSVSSGLISSAICASVSSLSPTGLSIQSNEINLPPSITPMLKSSLSRSLNPCLIALSRLSNLTQSEVYSMPPPVSLHHRYCRITMYDLLICRPLAHLVANIGRVAFGSFCGEVVAAFHVYRAAILIGKTAVS